MSRRTTKAERQARALLVALCAIFMAGFFARELFSASYSEHDIPLIFKSSPRTVADKYIGKQIKAATTLKKVMHVLDGNGERYDADFVVRLDAQDYPISCSIPAVNISRFHMINIGQQVTIKAVIADLRDGILVVHDCSDASK